MYPLGPVLDAGHDVIHIHDQMSNLLGGSASIAHSQTVKRNGGLYRPSVQCSTHQM